MNRKQRTRDSFILLINMLIVLVNGFLFYECWYFFYHDTVYFYQRGNWLILFIYLCSVVFFNYLYGGFKLGLNKISELIFSNILSNLFALGIIFVQASLVSKSFVPLGGFGWMYLVETIYAVFINIVANKFFYHIFSPLNCLLLYQGDSDDISLRMQRYHSDYYAIRNKMSMDEVSTVDKSVLLQYDCVFISGLNEQNAAKIIALTYELTMPVFVVPTYAQLIIKSAQEQHLIDVPIFKANRFGPTQLSKIVKRGFDILFSVVLLILLSPLFLLVALAIKLEDGGPIIYCQCRLTQYGRCFNILKFRSMRVDAEKEGYAQLAKVHDDRITSVGRIIRACRMDELPQLVNILKGDMSIVGPRPERPEIAEKIIKELPEFSYRLKVKSGLTGYAQVYGKYNTQLKDKLLFDLFYIENYSLILDMKIVLMTIKTIFSKESTEGVDA